MNPRADYVNAQTKLYKRSVLNLTRLRNAYIVITGLTAVNAWESYLSGSYWLLLLLYAAVIIGFIYLVREVHREARDMYTHLVLPLEKLTSDD